MGGVGIMVGMTGRSREGIKGGDELERGKAMDMMKGGGAG